MAAGTGDFKAKITGQLRNFSTGQKIGMVAAAIAVVATLLVVSKWSGKQDMAPLFTSLAPADAASVTEKLTAQKESYQLADGGATIMVPRSKLYSLRIAMAAAGLPADNNTGWSILDKQGLTASDFTQQVAYKRALEGELSKEIASIDAVETATVQLVLPKNDAFALNDTKASASVLLKNRPGKTLDASKVQAIVHLVASSVQGLTPETVSVADTNGRLLKAAGTDTIDASAGSTQLDQTQSYQNSLGTSIENMLASVVGAGKATVKVNADLNYDKQQATSETYTDPQAANGQRIAKETSNKAEQYTGDASQGATGVLGPVTTAGTTGTGTGNNSSYKSSEDRTSYAVNRVVSTTETAPGQIKRLSVAVLVDSKSVDDAQVENIKQLVSAAAGISSARGDQVVVTRMPFDTSQADQAKSDLQAAATQKAKDARNKLFTTLGTVALVLLVLGFAYRSISKGRRTRQASTALDLLPSTNAGALTAGDEVIELDELFVPPTALEPASVLLGPAEQPALATAGSKLAEMAEHQPEEVAMLLRTWLGDRWGAKR